MKNNNFYFKSSNLKLGDPATKSGEHNMPTIGDEACPAMRFDVKMPVMRAQTKEMLANMEKENPELFVSLKKAFENIQVSSFCDERFLEELS